MSKKFKLATAALIVCAGTTAHAVPTPSCDEFRTQLREQTLESVGFGLLKSQMKAVSKALTAEERKDLIRLTAALDHPGALPAVQGASAKGIRAIYRAAIKRSEIQEKTIKAGAQVRTLQPDPTGSDPLLDGNTVVMTSTLRHRHTRPHVGDVTDAFLAVSADQSKYEMILVRTTRVRPGPHGRFAAESDYVSMADYLKAKAPSSCR